MDDGSRDRFDGRSSPRTWLCRIATNACLDTLRRVTPRLQPYPDQLLDEKPGPEAAAVARETVRDVMLWWAAAAADLLGTTVRAANSALHRARTTVREQWPDGRMTWAPAGEPDAAQRELLTRYIAAHEQADPEALIDLLGEDIRLTIEPDVGEWTGRPAVAQALREGMNSLGRWRMLATAANRRPAAGAYVLAAGDTAFRPFGLIVLTVEASRLTAIDTFEDPGLFTAFGLPASLDS